MESSAVDEMQALYFKLEELSHTEKSVTKRWKKANAVLTEKIKYVAIQLRELHVAHFRLKDKDDDRNKQFLDLLGDLGWHKDSMMAVFWEAFNPNCFGCEYFFKRKELMDITVHFRDLCDLPEWKKLEEVVKNQQTGGEDLLSGVVMVLMLQEHGTDEDGFKEEIDGLKKKMMKGENQVNRDILEILFQIQNIDKDSGVEDCKLLRDASTRLEEKIPEGMKLEAVKGARRSARQLRKVKENMPVDWLLFYLIVHSSSADFTAANEESDDDLTAANEVSDDWKKILNKRELDIAKKALSKVQLAQENNRKAKIIDANLKPLPADIESSADVEASGFRF